MQSLTVSISGMTCVNCVNTVKKSLEHFAGIEKIDINIVQNRADIFFDETKIDEESIIAHINTTPYRAYRQRSEGQEVQEWKNRSILGIVLSIPLAILMGMEFFSWHTSILMTYAVLISWIVATIVQIVLGRVFYKGAWNALKLRSTNMFTLIATGSGVTYLFSLWNMGKSYIALGSFEGLSMEGIFFEVGVFLVVFISIGKYLESIAKLHSSKGIKHLETLRPQTAFVQEGKEYIKKTIDLVEIGDIVRVNALEAIPLDGEIIEYQTTIDESTLTGESMPTAKKVGDTVYAGTINITSTILMRVTKVGSSTLLGQIIESVGSAYVQKSDIENFSDRIASILIPVILSLSFLTFFIWYFLLSIPIETALLYACSVVVIACPCALGLATPTAVTVGMSWATSQGILVKGGVFLEKIASMKHIFFDKTGTLTTGKFQIGDIRSSYDDTVFMPIACSLQSHSNHPIATAFSAYAQKNNISLQEIENVKLLHSEGISGTYKKDHYMIGNKKALQKYGFSSSDFQDADTDDLHIYLGKNHEIIAKISLIDTPRAGGKELIDYLQKQKINVFLLTGDRTTVAQKVAQEIGIPPKHIYSEIFPQQKAEIIKKYSHAVMLGDGVNDSVAFAHASVGVSMGKGNDIALSTADVIVLKNSLGDIKKLHIIAQATKTKITQNLVFSLIYNMSGIPIAAGVFTYWGNISITPQFAGLAMILSSVGVLTNTLTLKMRPWISWGMFGFLLGFFSIFFGMFIF